MINILKLFGWLLVSNWRFPPDQLGHLRVPFFLSFDRARHAQQQIAPLLPGVPTILAVSRDAPQAAIEKMLLGRISANALANLFRPIRRPLSFAAL